MSINGTLVEVKMRRFKCECAYFSFKKCLFYIYDGASAKFSTNSHEMDNSVSVEVTSTPAESSFFKALALLKL